MPVRDYPLWWLVGRVGAGNSGFSPIFIAAKAAQQY